MERGSGAMNEKKLLLRTNTSAKPEFIGQAYKYELEDQNH